MLLDRILELCQLKNISISALESGSGIAKNTIRRWDSVVPSIDKVAAVARFFDVSIDYLYGASDTEKSAVDPPACFERVEKITEDERLILLAFRSVSDAQRQELLKVSLKMMLEK